MPESLYTFTYASPLGLMTLAGGGSGLTGLWFLNQAHYGAGLPAGATEKALPIFGEAARWLDAYFSGRDPGPTPPLSPQGSPFQLSVWRALRDIPYGHTASYSDIAASLAALTAKPVSPRAVGGAVGRNPISILIPCHRVLGKDGSLTGYAGGLDVKRRLLALEGVRGGRGPED